MKLFPDVREHSLLFICRKEVKCDRIRFSLLQQLYRLTRDYSITRAYEKLHYKEKPSVQRLARSDGTHRQTNILLLLYMDKD